MFFCEYCEIFLNSFFFGILLLLLTPIRYPYVTSERENEKIRLQVRFTPFTSLSKRKHVHLEV